jgi:hypothetical protein
VKMMGVARRDLKLLFCGSRPGFHGAGPGQVCVCTVASLTHVLHL